jgi:superfamily II DNA or RNA helicase
MKPKLYIRDRIYIPVSTIPDTENVARKYTRHIFKDSGCRSCEYLNDRPCFTCESCANYSGPIKLWVSKTIAGVQYAGIPIGAKKNVERKLFIDFNDYRVIDNRTTAPFDYKIKFTLELRPHQTVLVSDFLKSKYGLLEAPPRTGKTVLLLYIGLKLGQRMLLLANQHEYLQQFLWHIEGNEAEGIPKCTNLPELQAKYGKKLYGFPKTEEDFRTMQFMVMTYQSLSDTVQGKKRFNLLSENIGTVGIDEAHKVGANIFAKTLNSFKTRYRFGVTGTVERKDHRHVIVKDIIGPVVAKATVEAMNPKVFIKGTGIKLKRDPSLWVYKMKALCNDKSRNEMIVQRCVKDVRAGHSVVIPLIFTKHIRDIVSAINEAYGEPIAEAFVGGGAAKQKKARQDILSRAKSGETKVIVGTRSLLQLGLNVPRWSAIYTAIPISNKPNYKQETSRVRTPMEGKRRPIIRLFYDERMPASVACAKNSLAHMVEFGYEISSDKITQEAVVDLSRWKSGRSRSDDAQFEPVQLVDDDATSFGRAKAGRR